MVTMDPLTGCNCVTGYVLQSSTCVLCSIVIPNCDVCNSLTVTCSQCFNPYYLSGGSPACQACPTGCTSCTNATYCNGCIPGYDYDVSIVNTRYCGCTSLDCTVNCPTTTLIPACTYCNVSPIQCLGCAPGHYYSSPSDCNFCPFTCATCNSSVCITCKPTFNLISGKCVCNTALQQYFEVVNQVCTACGSLDPLCTSTINCCTSCVNNVHAVTGLPIGTTCTACPVGWYPDPFGTNQVTCAQCPSTCTACNNALSCISCQPSYLIVGGSGVCACDTSSQYF
jgi:proprotein convertase subtilisin/kexin type 5